MIEKGVRNLFRTEKSTPFVAASARKRFLTPFSDGTKGFSILEVLVAMAVLTVVAGSLLALFAAASSTHRRSVDRTRAALIADEVVAQVRLVYAPGTKPADVVTGVRARVPELIDGYRWEVTAFHPQGDGWTEAELWVHVAIRWKRSGKAREETFATIVLPRNP